jgi:hypothetical protein
MANPLITNYDRSKTFVWNPRTEVGNYTNSGYDDVTLAKGTLMGRIASSNLLTPLTSGASDGSQFPVGVVLADTVVASGDTAEITICVAGDVDENKLVFQGSDTLATVVSSRTLRDRIGADTVGIKLVGGNQLTGFDNQ